jgi:hypothetical protein
VRALSTSELLELWERGAGLHLLDRGLLALSTALPDVSAASIADWPLGQRNRALLELYRSAFDPMLRGWAQCSECGEKMEFEIDARKLEGSAADGGSDTVVEWNGGRYRLPTSRDLAEVSRASTTEAATIALVNRCQSGDAREHEFGVEELEALGESLAAADSLAEVRIALTCPSCGNESDETIELVAFLWTQLEGRARRVFWEVHALASAYGWNEREVLSLTPMRRAHYLAMVQA